MSNACRSWLLTILLAWLASGALAREGESPAAPGGIWVLTVAGAIGPATSDYVRRELAAAESAQVELVVLLLDTPGCLDTSMRDIVQAILASKVPVATYVHPDGARAASAGTFILYASHVAAMAPATNLGAATPVQIGMPINPGGSGEKPEPPSALTAKATNDAAAYIRSLAELRGRNADWAEQAVREAASLSAPEAQRQRVVDLLAKDLDELLLRLDGRRVTVDQQTRTLRTAGRAPEARAPDWRTEFLEVITDPNLVLVLGMIGFYGLLLEFYNPGFGVPGVTGAICLLLAAFGMQMLPVNYAGLAFILLGIALLIAEAMTPSFILGAGGVLSMALGGVILIDTQVDAFRIAGPVIAATVLVSAALILTTVHLALRMRRRPTVSGVETLVGSRAIARESFDHEGMVHIDGELWRAVCEEPVAAGDALRVLAVEGLTLSVTKEE